MNPLQLLKQLLTRPMYSAELTFVGVPFFFLQVLVFGIAYISYKLVANDGVGSFSFTAETIREHFDVNTWFLLAPIAAALAIKAASLALQRNIVLTWRHWFWSFASIDSFFYGLALWYLIGQGVFQAANGMTGLAVIVGLYTITILFTFLHFYLYEKIGKVWVKNSE